jgi:hypothetical protein
MVLAIISIIAGLLVLIIPGFLRWIVGIYLIIAGILALGLF